jgi:integrase
MESNKKIQVDQSTAVVMAGINILSEKLNVIDKKVTAKIPEWNTSEAVIVFRNHLEKKHKKPRNFKHILELFSQEFGGRNIAVINAIEIEEFLSSNWGDSKNSTKNARLTQVSMLFSFAIKEMQRMGKPRFHNPCDLIDKAKHVAPKENVYIEPGLMVKFLGSFDKAHHWLWVAIGLSAGLRISEILNLRPMDVDGRILTLLNTKGGREREYAVIPVEVSERLQRYIYSLEVQGEDMIWASTNVNTPYKVFKKHGDRLGLNIGTHSLRKWCATTYDRAGDTGMVRYVLRHASGKGMTSLESRYIAPYDNATACSVQDKITVPLLFEDHYRWGSL